MRRAEEEITRLNVEIRRFVTYLQDEDRYLRDCEALLCASSPVLAHQVKILRNVHARFNAEHLAKFVGNSSRMG
jgi:hypothetical protein